MSMSQMVSSDMNNDNHYTFKASVEAIPADGQLTVSADLGFGVEITETVYLYGIDSEKIGEMEPDDPDDTRRGNTPRGLIGEWVFREESVYDGEHPFSIITLHTRGDREVQYEALIYSRSSQSCLNDVLRREFPEVAV